MQSKGIPTRKMFCDTLASGPQLKEEHYLRALAVLGITHLHTKPLKLPTDPD